MIQCPKIFLLIRKGPDIKKNKKKNEESKLMIIEKLHNDRQRKKGREGKGTQINLAFVFAACIIQYISRNPKL